MKSRAFYYIFVAVFSCFLFSNHSFAQEAEGGSEVSGEEASPRSVNALLFLLTRVHTLGLSGVVEDMNANGISFQKMVAQFDASGALVFFDEMNRMRGEYYENRGTNDGMKITGRNVGAQAIPFTISIKEGEVYLSAAAVSWKNMNTANANGVIKPNSGWEVFNELTLFNFKWDKNFNQNGVEVLDLGVLEVGTRLDILDDLVKDDRNYFLAWSVNAGIGANLDTEINVLTNDPLTLNSGIGSGIYIDTATGLLFNAEFKRSRLQLGFDLQWQNRKARTLHPDTYDAARSEYDSRKAQYNSDLATYEENIRIYCEEVDCSPLSDDSLDRLIGQTKPRSIGSFKAPSSKIIRWNILNLRPEMSFYKRLNRKGKKPFGVAISTFFHVPLVNQLEGGGGYQLYLPKVGTGGFRLSVRY